jgi:hypothetical protein
MGIIFRKSLPDKYLYRLQAWFFLKGGVSGSAGREADAMDEQTILDELLALLKDNGIKVRSEPMGGSGGGLCTIKGQSIFFIDTESTAAETAGLCAEAVAKLVNIEAIYLRPEVRQYIEERTGQAW